MGPGREKGSPAGRDRRWETGRGVGTDRPLRTGRRVLTSMQAILAVNLLLLAGPCPAEARQSPPFARAQLAPGASVTVGQPVEIRVEVLVSTWFSRAPEFPSLSLESAIVVPPGRSVNFNERVGGQQYFGIRRAYTVYPQVAGSYEVPEISLTVRPGGSDEVVTVSTNPLSFEARIPPEAAGLGYFIGTLGLTLSQSVEPRADTLKVGDAITRTIEMTVLDALSLVLPPLVFDSVPGLAVYPEPAAVTDEGGERGTRRIGRRVESVIYVLEEEGSYALPEVEIAWWDLGGQRLRRSTIPPVQFYVQANPDHVTDFAMPPDPDSVRAEGATGGTGISLTFLALGISGVLLLAGFLWILHRFGPRWRGRYRRWQRERGETEAAHFRRFRSACRANDPVVAMDRLLAWLDKINGEKGIATVGRFLAAADDPALREAVRDLERRLFATGGRPPDAWKGSRLLEAVGRHRPRVRSAPKPTGRPRSLAPLNPGGP